MDGCLKKFEVRFLAEATLGRWRLSILHMGSWSLGEIDVPVHSYCLTHRPVV